MARTFCGDCECPPVRRTFGALRTSVLNWLDEASAPVNGATWTNVSNALRQAHDNRLQADNWKFMLWPRFETLAITSGRQIYSLHQAFGRSYTFRNTTTRDWMVETPSRNIDPMGVDYNNDTDTQRFALWTRSPVQNQPTSASVLTISSSSTDDTGIDFSVEILGDTADGITKECITADGTSDVVGTVEFTQIISVTKRAPWTGILHITSNTGAVAVLTLFPKEFGRSYQQIQMLFNPSGDQTVQYRFYRIPKDLCDDNDMTDIPAPFEQILIYDALLLMAAYDNRLDAGRIGVWTQMRDEIDFSMRQNFIEGLSISAEPRYVRSYDADWGGPRVRGLS